MATLMTSWSLSFNHKTIIITKSFNNTKVIINIHAFIIGCQSQVKKPSKIHESFILTIFFQFLVQVETTKTQNPLEYNSTFAEESLTFTNPLEDIEDYEEDEEVVPSPVLDPDLEAKVKLVQTKLSYLTILL